MRLSVLEELLDSNAKDYGKEIAALNRKLMEKEQALFDVLSAQNDSKEQSPTSFSVNKSNGSGSGKGTPRSPRSRSQSRVDDDDGTLINI